MLYAIRPLADGWAVTDALSGKIVTVDDEPQVGLSLNGALDVVDLLCRIEAHKPARLN